MRTEINSFLATIAPVVIAVTILAFPLLLPFVIFAFFAHDNDEGYSNEELWARKRRSESEVTGQTLMLASTQFVNSWIVTSQYNSQESVLSWLTVGVSTLPVEGQPTDGQFGLEFDIFARYDVNLTGADSGSLDNAH